ncbi:hypothetical protein SLA2020_370510 [Shorea laevis]
MGRNLSPILRRELENLDKDANSRKSAMRALKSYVKDLDSKAIPIFLAQVSETKETGSLSGEYTISLYEACSKVVPAIARYGIDPTMPEDKKRHIIRSLCKPLSDSLLGSQESLTSGSALCLRALVECDNWRFASNEMVNRVCQNVAGALEEKSTQTNAHMGLVMALGQHNPLIVEPYARLLINSGLRILNAGLSEGNSQKGFSAIQMINFLMKCLDSRSVFSEVELIIEEMQKCQSDQMGFIEGAAYEAEQTAKKIAHEIAKKIAHEIGSKIENHCGSVTGSNFSRREHSRRRSLLNSGDRSSASVSPESHTVDSFGEYDSFVESPVSTTQVSHDMGYDHRSVNRKLWSYENGVDVSLRDGLFSEVTGGIPIYDSPSEHHELTGNGEENTDEFSGFLQRNPRSGLRSSTPSPQRSRCHINVDDVNIVRAPRKLIHLLQDPNIVNSDFSESQPSRFRSPSSGRFQSHPSQRQNGFQHELMHEFNGKESLCNDGEHYEGVSESVSSTNDSPADGDLQVSHEVVPLMKTEILKSNNEVSRWKKVSKMLLMLFSILLVVLIALICSGGWDEGDHLVPT